MPTILVDPVELLEGDGTFDFLDFIVELSEPSQSEVRIPWSITGATALGHLDVRVDAGELRIAPGTSFGTIRTTINRDVLPEADEFAVLELLKPPNADFLNGQNVLRVPGIILDEDGAPGLALYVSSPTHREGSAAPAPRFELLLSRPAPSTLTIDYTFAGSARPGLDYVAPAGQVTIPAGGRTAFIEVGVLDDPLAEGLETVELRLELPSAIVSATGGRLEIADDERTLPLVSVSTPVVNEGNGTFDFLDFVVTLSEPSANQVSVNWRSLAGTASEPDDFGAESGTIRFNPGQQQAIVRETFNRDDLPERDETILIELSSPVGAVLPGGVNEFRSVGFIIDDDGEALPLALNANDVTVREGDGGTRDAVIDLELSRPAPTGLVFDYQVTSDSATPGADFVAETGQVVFQRGSTTASLAVRIVGDETAEQLEFVDVTFAALPTVTVAETARITVIDNDGPGTVTAGEARTIAYLYEAGLDRDGNIDLPGLNFWIDQFEAGRPILQISQDFLDSAEFAAATGDPATLSDRELVEGLYLNVLNREGEQAGVDFWTGVAGLPDYSRARLLLDFAVSGENVENSPAVLQLAEVDQGDWAFLG